MLQQVCKISRHKPLILFVLKHAFCLKMTLVEPSSISLDRCCWGLHALPTDAWHATRMAAEKKGQMERVRSVSSRPDAFKALYSMLINQIKYSYGWYSVLTLAEAEVLIVSMQMFYKHFQIQSSPMIWRWAALQVSDVVVESSWCPFCRSGSCFGEVTYSLDLCIQHRWMIS